MISASLSSIQKWLQVTGLHHYQEMVVNLQGEDHVLVKEHVLCVCVWISVFGVCLGPGKVYGFGSVRVMVRIRVRVRDGDSIRL